MFLSQPIDDFVKTCFLGSRTSRCSKKPALILKIFLFESVAKSCVPQFSQNAWMRLFPLSATFTYSFGISLTE